MVSTVENQYMPDVVSAPGETLLEAIEERNMTQAELAERMGRHRKTINEIIAGKAPITPDTALQFERVLNIPASFWNNRERLFREYLARNAEKERLEDKVDWLDNFPLREMIKAGWVQKAHSPIEQLRELLNFFGVVSPEQLDGIWSEYAAAFRLASAYESDRGALLAWLRKGEIEAQKVFCAPFSRALFREKLEAIRSLTVESPEVFQREMTRLCAEAGVAVVFVPQLAKARVSGATRWLAPDKAIIQLSLRYKRDDQLWFSFFHEAGHLLLHGKRDVCVSIDYDSPNDAKEQEANRFAADFLIPPGEWAALVVQCRETGTDFEELVRQFAAQSGIAPGIVVGRLQREKYMPYDHCTKLFRRLAWVE